MTSVQLQGIHRVYMPSPSQPHIKASVGPYNRVVPPDRVRHPCRCGHPYTAHRHYRYGSECSFCSACPRYRAGITRVITFVTNMLNGRTGPPASR